MLLRGTVLTTDRAVFLFTLPKMATRIKEQLAHFHTSHLSSAIGRVPAESQER